MDYCLADRLDTSRYLQRFNRKVQERRIPLYGSIDLTHQCNFNCVHCYLGEQQYRQKKNKRELTTAQWITIIDQITAAGCLNLLITGGDPLLRDDFIKIYRHAKLNGLLVTVFTNGTLITKQILNLFQELPPRSVEITLYAATQKTYERITGIRNSHSRCLEGIESLLQSGTRIRLKSVLMTLNQHEFSAIEQIAENYGVPFRMDSALFPKFSNDNTPLQLRVPPRQAVDLEFTDAEKKQQWSTYYNKMKSCSLPDTVYTCGSGISGFHINAAGKLQPCLMMTRVQYNLVKGDFATGWRDVIPQFLGTKMTKDNKCRSCPAMPLCGYCPAFFDLENGSEEKSSQYICELGMIRLEKIQQSEIMP